MSTSTAPPSDLPSGRRADATHHADVRRSIEEGAVLTAPYILMNALATVVACYGLLGNSTAVVIGAMIIAMLLGPITGIGLALVDGNQRLLRRAFVTEVSGVVVVLAVAYVIGKIHRDLPLTSELLARTKPNIIDLIIALAGGAAGAYATVSPRLSVGLVGVAIATALVPPLSTCSICLARGDTARAGGGFLLFVANLVAIQFASSVVMWLHGLHRITNRLPDRRAYITRIGVSVVLLLGLTIVLAVNFARSFGRQRYENSVRDRLRGLLARHPGVYLADLRFTVVGPREVVTAVVRTPNSFTPEMVGEVEDGLPRTGNRPLELHLRSVLTKEATRQGYLHGTAPITSDVYPGFPNAPEPEPLPLDEPLP